MKKIITSLALLAVGASGAYAQQYIDLFTEALIAEDTTVVSNGVGISVSGILDQNTPPTDSLIAAIVYGIGPNGGPLMTNQQFFFTDVTRSRSADGSMSGLVIAPATQDYDPGSTGILYTYQSRLTVTDSIFSLLDITNFEAGASSWDSIIVNRPELVVGQTYGFWSYVTEYPFSPNNSYSDTSRSDNFDYVPVVWTGGSSIADLLHPKYTPIEVYPNPAVNTVSFNLDFKKMNNSTVARVLDINGRQVFSKALGASNIGTQRYSLDVSQLPTASYSIQIITDNAIYTQKFIKK